MSTQNIIRRCPGIYSSSLSGQFHYSTRQEDGHIAISPTKNEKEKRKKTMVFGFSGMDEREREWGRRQNMRVIIIEGRPHTSDDAHCLVGDRKGHQVFLWLLEILVGFVFLRFHLQKFADWSLMLTQIWDEGSSCPVVVQIFREIKNGIFHFSFAVT